MNRTAASPEPNLEEPSNLSLLPGDRVVAKPITSVQIVSDGIVVRFSDGVLSYFSQSFLQQHIGVGSNQIFLDHDPYDTSSRDDDLPLQ